MPIWDITHELIATSVVLDGDKNYTPGDDGIMFHLDTSTLTDNVTADCGTATKVASVALEAPTLAATLGFCVTATDAATLYISGAPAAAFGVSITRAHSLWVDSGNVRFDGGIYMGTSQLVTSALAIDTGTSNVTSGGIFKVDVDSGATIDSSGGGINAAGSITLGAGNDAGLYVKCDNLYTENKTSDKDLIFRVNDGGTFTEVARIVGSVSAMRFAEIGTPAQPAGGAGGYLYAKADGKPYWRSNEIAETALDGGGGVVSGGTDNAILRADGTGGSTSQGSAVTIADTTGDITLPAAGQIFLGVGAAANPSYAFICGTNTGIFNPAAADLAFTTAGAERLRILGSRFLWGETVANANNCNGFTINQADTDDEILAFKSSDVGHSITGITEADTYATFKKRSASAGGLGIFGFAEGGNHAFQLQSHSESDVSTSKGTGSEGMFIFDAYVDEGAMGANTNIVAIRGGATTRFIFDNEGSGHADVEWTTYSDDRLKFNQSVIPYGLDTLMQLQPKIYCKDSGYLSCGVPVLEGKRRRQIGFVAQEVMALMPEAVKNVCSATSWYSLEDGKLTALVVKAIQELSSKVTALESK